MPSGPDEEDGHFLVEWYGADLARAPLAETRAALELAAVGHQVYLQLIMAAPCDDVLFGVFGADCAASVQQTCRDAGLRPNRITTDIRTLIAPSTRRAGRWSLPAPPRGHQPPSPAPADSRGRSGTGLE